MRTRIFRALVCLVLVAALLVQVSPIQARAVSSWIWVPAGIAIGYALLGLGAGAAVESQQNVISDLATDAYNWLTLNYSYYTDDDRIRIWSTSNPDMPYAIDEGLLEALFGWMWDNEIISGGPCASYTTLTLGPSPHGSSCIYTHNAPFTMFAFTLNGAPAFVFVSTSYTPIEVDAADTNYNDLAFHKQVNSVWYGSFYANVSAGYPWGLVDLGSFSSGDAAGQAAVNAWSGSDITTDKDITLGEVAPAGSSIPEGYSIWNENAMLITDDDGTQRYVYPITLTDAYKDSLSITQADVWAGVGSTYVDSNTDVGTGDDTVTVPETVTLKDILTGILSVPKSIAQAVAAFFADVVAAVKAIPAAITEFFTISADVSAFAIEWRDFFPFCIPFDIYDFLTLLMAEPEAPKFEWEIDLLKTGEPYLMVVDLSEWDDVAQLLRRLELLVFIVGLAMVTREKYIRG